MQRVLVTGGAGFIGSHIVERLLETDAQVLVLDSLRLGRREHLAFPGVNGALQIVQGDIRDAGDLQAIKSFRPDTVFHMAALHFIPYCAAHPDEAFDVNVRGLKSVLDAVRDAPLETFVFPSSGAVYGFGHEPWREGAPSRPDSVYGRSKVLGEQVLSEFQRRRPEVRAVAARLFSSYGPRETNPHVLPDILQAIEQGRTIELGNLWPKRDLIFVTDTAAAVLASAVGPAGFEVFNVGTGVGTTIEDVVEAIEGLMGNSFTVRQVPERMREVDGHLISDPGKLMEATGWRPQYDLQTGLRRLLEAEGLR